MKTRNENDTFERKRNMSLSQHLSQKQVHKTFIKRFRVVIWMSLFSDKRSQHFMGKRWSNHILEEVALNDVQGTFYKVLYDFEFDRTTICLKLLVYQECSLVQTKIKNNINIDHFLRKKIEPFFVQKMINHFLQENDACWHLLGIWLRVYVIKLSDGQLRVTIC